jgi:sec-independent protein translocase protein TatA
MLPNMGFGDWVIVLVLVLLLFGAKKLPELARAIGQSMTAFKKGMKEGEEEEKTGGKDKK